VYVELRGIPTRRRARVLAACIAKSAVHKSGERERIGLVAAVLSKRRFE
jgi:hypothetical protein